MCDRIVFFTSQKSSFSVRSAAVLAMSPSVHLRIKYVHCLASLGGNVICSVSCVTQKCTEFCYSETSIYDPPVLRSRNICDSETSP